ncbi:MAG TPA: hypothetical protein VG406_01545 [Isosphaeraceae bacterium]|jgi:hypothetical protein|nr:hypothetical protein [Isosphaeraceae bacterium]
MQGVSKRRRVEPGLESLEGRSLLSVGLHGRVTGTFAVANGPLPGVEVVSFDLHGRAPRVGPVGSSGSFLVPGTGLQSLLPSSRINGVPVLATSSAGAVAGPADLVLQQINRNFARLTVLGTVTTGTGAFTGATGSFHALLRLDLRNDHVSGTAAGVLR